MNPYDLPVDRGAPKDEEPAGPRPTTQRQVAAASTEKASLLGEAIPTAAAALQWYIDNDGLSEQPPGSNHVPGVTDRCGLGNVAWCAEAVSVALMAAGFGSIDDFTIEIPGLWMRYGWGIAYCPDWVQTFRDAGRWHLSDPQPGDVVLFDWDGDGWADHVGLVEQDLGDGTVLTREGNADDRVIQKRRSVQDILGYGRPPYAATEEDDMFTDEDRAMLRTVRDYIEDRKAPDGLDDGERFTAQVLTEHVGAIEQAGDGSKRLGWRRFVATLKGVKRPKA